MRNVCIIILMLIVCIGNMNMFSVKAKTSEDRCEKLTQLIMLSRETSEEEKTESEKQALNKFNVSKSAKSNVINTFDAKRTFSGVTEASGEVEISVYQIISEKVKALDGTETFVEKTELYECVKMETGVSGIFSLEVNIPLGESAVVVYSSKENRESFEVFAVNRLAEEVKKEINERKVFPFTPKPILNEKPSFVVK